MRALILAASLWLGVAHLAGCSGSGGAGEEPGPVEGQAGHGGSEGVTGPNPDPSPPGDGEPDAPLDPGTPPAETPGGEPLTRPGLSVDGRCFAVCASAATDADASGQTDGWGWEDAASCLVAGSMPASAAVPCALPGPLPLPPPSVPMDGVARPEGVDSSGFFVANGRLLDGRGNDFVMRGINSPLAWYRDRQTGALAWTEQIASTGANTVRLVWETTATDTTLLRDAIARTIEFGMVPMVELHDVTGGQDVDDPARMARYYAETDEVRQILLDHEDYLLVNIANEWDGADGIYVEAYTRAIETLRAAGINHTLVLDSNGYGQRANTVIEQGQTLLGVDPQHNLLFSAHMYQEFRSAPVIVDTLARAAAARIPFIVGEFGFQHGTDNQGNPIQIPFQTLLDEAQRLGIGYLAWSWTGNSGGVEYLDLTARSGSASELSAWGNDVIEGDNGIRATAEPASIFLAP